MVDTNSKCSIVLLEASCNNNASPFTSDLHPATNVDVDRHSVTPEILVTSPRHIPKPHLDDIKLAEETESDESQESDRKIEDSDLEFIDLNQEENLSVQSMLSLDASCDHSNSHDSANISTFQTG